jgi:hypothetical protein
VQAQPRAEVAVVVRGDDGTPATVRVYDDAAAPD